jgi:hypothetical protein
MALDHGLANIGQAIAIGRQNLGQTGKRQPDNGPFGADFEVAGGGQSAETLGLVPQGDVDEVGPTHDPAARTCRIANWRSALSMNCGLPGVGAAASDRIPMTQWLTVRSPTAATVQEPASEPA